MNAITLSAFGGKADILQTSRDVCSGCYCPVFATDLDFSMLET